MVKIYSCGTYAGHSEIASHFGIDGLRIEITTDPAGYSIHCYEHQFDDDAEESLITNPMLCRAFGDDFTVNTDLTR